MSDFRGYDPTQDPALTGKASWLVGTNPAYPGRVQAFNSSLYTPMDRKPSAPSRAAWRPAAGDFGYATSGGNVTRFGNASGNIVSPSNSSPAFNPGPPISGGTTVNPWQPPEWRNTGYQMPDQTGTGNPAAPPQNAMQRWMGGNDNGSGLKPLSPTTRYFWATNRIDARAPKADLSQNIGAVQPVQWKNSAQSTQPQQTPQSNAVGSGQPIQFINSVPGHSDWVSSL